MTLDGGATSYRALERASARVASLLCRHGLSPGDRVGLLLPNVPNFGVVHHGVLRAGGVVVPMNPQLEAQAIARRLKETGTGLLFAWHAVAEEAEAGAARAGARCLFVTPREFARLLASFPPEGEIARRDGDEAAVLLSSSSTSGGAHAMELTHQDLFRAGETLAARYALDEDDVVLAALPLFCAIGLTGSLTAALSAGGRLSLMPRFDPAGALEIVERDRVTVVSATSVMYAAILDHPRASSFDVSSLRVCISDGAALPPELVRGFEAAFGCTIVRGHGLSETTPVPG